MLRKAFNTAFKVKSAVYNSRTAKVPTASIEGVMLVVAGMPPRTRSLIVTGEYEIRERSLVRKYLSPDDKVLEAGASIGFISIFCQRALGIRSIAIIEPNAPLLATTRKNYDMNGLTMPKVFECAVGAEDGTVTFGISDDPTSSRTHDIRPRFKIVSVPQRTLGSMVKDLDFTPNVLIMDIEGGEVTVSGEDYARFDKVIVEFHPEFIGGQGVARVVNTLHDNGFVEVERENFVAYFVKRRLAPAKALPLSEQR